MKKVLSLLILLLIVNTFSEESKKKVYLLNVSNEEIPSLKLVESADLNLSDKFIADFKIVEEKIEGRERWLKVIFSKGDEKNAPYGKCKFGVNKPKVNNWSDYEVVKFEVYNPQDIPIKIDFMVREKNKPFSYADRFDTSLVIPPKKKSIQKIYLQGATNNNNEPFDLKNIYEWFIGIHNIGDEPIILYFGDIELSFEE